MDRPRSRLLSASIVLSIVSGTLLLSFLLYGCGGAKPGSGTPAPPLVKHGVVQGGMQPVSNSTIQLYAVGTAGDGSPATELLSQAVSTDASGEFDITGSYSCPSSASLVYVVALGGNPGLAAGTNNTALTLMAALGACGSITASTPIYVNELTTVAAVWALAPYISSYSNIGAGSADATAMADAFTLASYYANTSTGTVPGLNVPAGMTVPVAQLDTLADILASCVNTAGGVVGDGSTCGTLFAAATPVGETAPVDVIGAGKNIANNPTANVAGLFALVGATAPYQPTLEGMPASLALGLSPTSGLSLSSSALTFPSTTVGVASAPMTVTFRNTGAAAITLSGASFSGAAASDFSVAAGCPATLAAGASCAVQVVFTPSAAGTRSASLSILSSAANSPLTVSLTGTGVAGGGTSPPSSSLSVSPSALTFPSGTVGVTSAPLSVTVKNTGAVAITMSGVSFSGAAASDFSVAPGCPTTLAAGASCAVQVVFKPSAAGTRSASLSIPSNAANSPLTISLTGTGVAGGGGTPPPSSSLSVSPSALTFPSGTVGVASTPLSVTVTNTGAVAITLSGVSFSGAAAGDFGVAAGCPATLAVGASCVVQVVFTPSAAGTRSASLSIPSSAANSPLTVPLTGTGVAGGGGTPPPTLYGHVEGGVQPVSNSTIQMYAVGTTADGSAGTALLTQTVLTDANGDFNIAGDYTCPSATSLVYVVAVGGNPGLAAGTNNTALTMMAALGACGGLTASTPIYVNELTTVAAVWALAPYMSSYSSIGSSAGDAAALANAFTLASYYANPSTGTLPGLNVPAGTTVPVEEINTLADILATCVDSPGGAVGDGSACGTLFAATTPVGGTAPGNVISAGLNIADNPTANVAALFGLVPTSPVFQPTLTEAPADFTVGLAMSGLSASPGAIQFPATYVFFTGASQTLTISNNGTRPFAFNLDISDGVTLSIIGVNASDFSMTSNCSSSLASTASCTVQITFVPSATGVRNAALVIPSNAANSPLTVPLSGTGLVGSGGPITLSPSSLSFAQVGVPQNVTVANTGSSPVTIGGVTYGGDTSRTTSQTNDCGSSLAAQSICTLSVQVSSLNQTAQNGTLSVITSAASGAPTMAIQVEALSPPLESFSQTPISLGDWAVGVTSAPLTSYNALTVSTSDPISLGGSFVGPNASDFSLVPFGFYGSGQPNGAYNCFRTSCEITVAFTPGGPGLRTATLQTGLGNIPVSGYGIPAGPSFTISPFPQTYESVGTSSFPANLTIVNNGSTSLLLSKTTVTGPNAGDFTVSNQCGATALGSTGTCTNLTVVFTPTQLGPRTATLTITDATSGTAKSIPLNGTGETMAPVVTPSSPSFTNVDIGSVVTQTITVTAPNGDPVNFQAAGSKDYTLSTGACATTPCQVIITFKPSMLGSDGGFFLVVDPYSQLTTDLSIAANVGLAGASLSTSSLTFAARDVGTTSIPQVVTLINTGDIALTISGIAVNGANLGDFPIESNTCGANLAPAASCAVSISFAPSATGARSASLSIQNGSANSSLTVSLSGTGTTAGGPPPVEYGYVEGGVQPVSGSAIQLYAVGTTGYGSAATALLTQPVSTDENGDFNIAGDYTCPSAASLVYVVAVGGNPGLAAGTNNTALTMMAALGACGNLTATTPIRINELTTVAAVWSLAPYMNSYSSIGSDAGDATGIAEAFTLASYFVNPSTGTVPGLAVPAGWTVPVAQINTLADILASCVDTAGGVVGDGSACGTLFAGATPIGGTAPVDVIGAGMDIANDAPANISTLFGLVTGTAPYQPTLTPSDLALSLSPVLSLSASPSSLTFPSASIGFPSALSITLTNTSTTNILAPITVGTASLSGAAASDFTANNDCQAPLAAGESCTIPVTFTPSAAGVRSATLSIPSNATNSPLTVSLTGTGVALADGPITLSSSSLTFNGVGSQDVIVTNTGTVPVSIGPITTQITGNSIPEGEVGPELGETNNCGTTLAAQSICTISVEAESAIVPGYTGTVTLVSSAAPGSQTISVNVLPSTVFFNAAPIMFGDVAVGSPGIPAELVVWPPEDNIVNFPFGITITGPNASDFSVSDGGIGECTFLGCTATISFTPSAAGLRIATAVTTYGTIALSGTGTTGTTGAPTGPSFTVASSYVDPNPNTPVGGVSNGQLSVTNSGTTNLLLSGVVTGVDVNSFTATPSQCSPLAPTQTCIFTITFKPLQPGVKAATLTITDSSSGIQNAVRLSGGTKPTVTLTPTQLTFDNLQIGSISAPQTVAVTTSDGGPVTWTPVNGLTSFLVSTGTCFLQTPCQLTVRFQPRGSGAQSSTIAVTPAMAGGGIDLSLSGTGGVPAISLSTSSLTFDPHATGSISIPRTVTLTNTSIVALTISGMNFAGANPGDFPIESNTCGDTLAAGGSCTMAISFAPTATGARAATLQILNSTEISPAVIQLSGTGT